MNTNERIKMLKAMEFIARNVNNESFLNGWLALGVADGDIEYGDLSVGPDDADELEYYMEDEPLADHGLTLMGANSTSVRSSRSSPPPPARASRRVMLLPSLPGRGRAIPRFR